MGYNTRRKSLSLPSLGIHLPNSGSSSSSRTHRSPSDPKSAAAAADRSSAMDAVVSSRAVSASAPTSATAPAPAAKRRKRSHDSNSASPALPDRTVTDKDGGSAARTASSVLERTPPPSPSPTDGSAPANAQIANKIDTEGISDDIVVAVIKQLEKTGNRPHLIKELATVLASSNESIANSANAAALISSRLSIYLKRPWTALAPCPIVKELIPVHPRKVFFYLANSPHQPLPVPSEEDHQAGSKQLTPSVSAGSNDGDDDDIAVDGEIEDMESRRARLSPSPEVDLSNPDEIPSDDLSAQASSFSSRGLHHSHNHSFSHNHSAPPPPLEGDEREFTQTASLVRERTSVEDMSARAAKRSHDDVDTGADVDEKMHGADTETSETQQGQEASTSETREYDYFPSDFIQSQQSTNSDQQQQLDSLTESDLFAQSRSPSASSELSSASSSTSATSHGEVERTTLDTSNKESESAVKDDGNDAYASAVLKGPADITVGSGPAISAATKVRTHFRAETPRDPVDNLLESKLQVDAAAFDNGDNNVDIHSGQLVIAGAENTGKEHDVDIEMVDPMGGHSSMTKPVALSLGVLDYHHHALSAPESWSDLQSPETMDIHELDAIFADI